MRTLWQLKVGFFVDDYASALPVVRIKNAQPLAVAGQWVGAHTVIVYTNINSAIVDAALQSISYIDELILGTVIRAQNPQLWPPTIAIAVAVAVAVVIAIAVVVMVAPTFVLGLL